MADLIPFVYAENLLEASKEHCLIDARSPAEFLAGHIPGAVNIPILDDAQRHEVGLCYKQNGKEAAVELGFQLVGGDLVNKIRFAKQCVQELPVLVYCWRGGQRSSILSWLLSAAGLKVCRLMGGYKAYRQFALQQFVQPHTLVMITGKTGSGKTELLHELVKQNEFVIDLEGLANHRGSAFGGIEMPPQPTQEHFENLLAWQLSTMHQRLIWVEGESRFIGKLRIPDHFFAQMQNCRSVQIEQNLSRRIHRILKEYGEFDHTVLREKTQSITKRMGGDRVKLSLEALESGDMEAWLIPLLEYYDKTYMHSIDSRSIPPMRLEIDGLEMHKIVSEIIAYGKNGNA